MILDPAELRREIEYKRSAAPKTVGQLWDREFIRLSLNQASEIANALEERDRLRELVKEAEPWVSGGPKAETVAAEIHDLLGGDHDV